MSLDVANWGGAASKSEKDQGSSAPSLRKSKLGNVRQEKALAQLTEGQDKEKRKLEARQHSNTAGHFRRYPTTPTNVQTTVGAKTASTTDQQKNIEMMETKQDRRSPSKQEEIEGKTPPSASPQPTRAQQIMAIQNAATPVESSAKRAAAAAQRAQIKLDIANVNARVKENLKRQQVIHMEKTTLKEEEEELIQKIERLKIASKAQVKDILAITGDLTPLGVGAFNVNEIETNNTMNDSDSSDDEDNSKLKYSDNEKGNEEGARERERESDEDAVSPTQRKNHRVTMESEKSTCHQLSHLLSSKFAISVMLFVSIVAGVFGVGLTLLAAGQSSVDNQVNATLRLAARQSEFQIRTAMDADFQRISLLADAMGRTDAAGTDAHIASDMLWLEARSMLQVSSALYVADKDGALHGAQLHLEDAKTKVYSTRLLENKDSTYKYFSTKLGGVKSSPDSVSLRNVKDVDKKRTGGTQGTVIESNYDPRKTAWYISAKAAAVVGQPANNVWSDIYRDAHSEAWTVTSARAVYSNMDSNGAVKSSSPKVKGVVAIDFNVQRIQTILEETRKSVFEKSRVGCCVHVCTVH